MKNGNIKMISANIFVIDEITSNVSTYIQKALNDSEKEYVKLSIGNFTGIKVLSGIGPDIKIKISSAGGVDTELKSEFVSQGINQTIHRIFLDVNCQVAVITPFKTIKENINSQVLLMENVIIGEIPNTYYNLEGLNSTKDALEVVE